MNSQNKKPLFLIKWTNDFFITKKTLLNFASVNSQAGKFLIKLFIMSILTIFLYLIFLSLIFFEIQHLNTSLFEYIYSLIFYKSLYYADFLKFFLIMHDFWNVVHILFNNNNNELEVVREIYLTSSFFNSSQLTFIINTYFYFFDRFPSPSEIVFFFDLWLVSLLSGCVLYPIKLNNGHLTKNGVNYNK